MRPGQPADIFLDLFGEIRVRAEDAARARVRVVPQPRHRNVNGGVHGGFLLALVDQCLFLGPTAIGIAGAMGGLTVDVATQFIGPAEIGRPLDAAVEVMRETGRMIFLRGTIEQDGALVMTFSGLIRKVGAAR